MSTLSPYLLVIAPLWALFAGILPAGAWAQAKAGWLSASQVSAPVSHRMAVGGVTGSTARFRVQSETSDVVNIELSTDTVSAPSLFGTSVRADAQRNNTVLIDVNGLQPDQLYYYRAWIGGTPQPGTQRFRTFPEAGTPATFTIGFGSCQQSGPFLPSTTPGRVFNAVANSGASLFLQIGDWGYPDTVDRLPANNNFFSSNYTLVQESYLTKFDPNYPMHAIQGTMAIDYVYDDHDYMNNNSSATTSSYFEVNQPGPGVTVLEIPNPAGAREKSIRGYVENMPTYPLANESRGIYHKFTIGNAEFFMLDLRSQRSPNLESFVRNTATGKWDYHVPPGHSILASPSAPGTGPTQLAWLLEGLKNSTAQWKFLVSSVPFNQAQLVAITLGLLWQDSIAQGIPGVPSGTPALFAALEFADKWVGFPADADTLLKTIRENNIANVIVLSGDSHTAAMDDGTNAGLPEIMAGCLDITNSRMAAAFASAGLHIWNRGGQGLTTPQFNDAFGRVTVYGADSVGLELVDENGSVFASQTIRRAQTGIGREMEQPAGFALEQNYPNPFNPETIIRYTIAGTRGSGLGTSRTRLVVYDLLGRQVAVLVDEFKAPGSYQVTFSAKGGSPPDRRRAGASGGDGSRFSSGVYFYRLTAGSFVQTRAMVLVK